MMIRAFSIEKTMTDLLNTEVRLCDAADCCLAVRPPLVNPRNFRLFSSLLSLGRQYSFEENHAIQVTSLAMMIFSKIADDHNFSDLDSDLLMSGAMLHDIGAGAKGHHKVSYQMIRRSSISGLDDRQRFLAALIARYHRKEEPSQNHAPYASLPESDQKLVDKLSAILRIADVLDRDHQQKLKSFEIEYDKDLLKIVLPPGIKNIIELKAFENKSRLFERAFSRRVCLS
ncbi:MAG: HD domain-containing protein [Candidatus Riflebacteria bacterium]